MEVRKRDKMEVLSVVLKHPQNMQKKINEIWQHPNTARSLSAMADVHGLSMLFPSSVRCLEYIPRARMRSLAQKKERKLLRGVKMHTNQISTLEFRPERMLSPPLKNMRSIKMDVLSSR